MGENGVGITRQEIGFIRKTALHILSKIFFALWLSCGMSTAVDAQYLIRQSDISFGTVAREQSFQGRGLYGYIDGGAEVYQEYGFVRLTVTDIECAEEKLSIELYEMKNPLAAFGIFSINRAQCAAIDSLFRFSCVDPYQLQGVQGQIYFRIISESGSPAAQQYSRRIAAILKERLIEHPAVIASLFDRKELQPHLAALRFVSGPLGVQNGIPDLEDTFEGMTAFAAYILPYEIDKIQIQLIDINFSSHDDALQYAIRLGFAGDKSYDEREVGRGRQYFWWKTPLHIISLSSSAAGSVLAPILHLIDAYQRP